MARSLICLIVSFFLLQSYTSGSWNITLKRNPECKDQCSEYNVVYMKAYNNTDSFHYFIDASSGFKLPSILGIHSSNPNPNVVINWNASIEENINFVVVENTTQSYGLGFLNLLEYDNTNETGPSLFKHHYMNNWSWSLSYPNVSNPLKQGELVELLYTANGSDKLFANNGTVGLKFMIAGGEQRNPALPHLLFVPGQLIQCELILDNLVTQFGHSRFSLQMVPVSNMTVLSGQQYRLDRSFSIFDEVTPSTFNMLNLLLAERVDMDSKKVPADRLLTYPPSFVQSKPICYTNRVERSLKSSRSIEFESKQAELTPKQRTRFYRSLVAAYYAQRSYQQLSHLRTEDDVRRAWSIGNAAAAPIGCRVQNITFDSNGDGYYALSNYTVWTFSFGFGEPPVDRPSTLVIGLLILALVFVIGSVLIGVMAIVFMRRSYATRQFEPLLQSTSA